MLWYVITGAIDTRVAHDLITWASEQVYAKQASQLTVFISSTGGDVDSAIRMYAYLKALPIEVNTIGFTQIDSAANTIFLAGKKRSALQGCRFFLHEGTYTIGNQTASLHSHEETLTVLKELLKRNIEIIASETGKTNKEIADTLRESKILTAKQAVEYGIATDIITKLPGGAPIGAVGGSAGV
ncbi:MAG TPA: ATP-dependent Clp protease proteolytic subunit [Candidatus Paceibacterota bacterium]|nr:ATP-dependent Clp protease proteolytic subunit [Candidatus Paceibacterota bacterium]